MEVTPSFFEGLLVNTLPEYILVSLLETPSSLSLWSAASSVFEPISLSVEMVIVLFDQSTSVQSSGLLLSTAVTLK